MLHSARCKENYLQATPIDILYVAEQYSYRCSIGEQMERNQTNLLQGTLDLLILKALGDGEFHGLGISRRIEQITQARLAFPSPSSHGRGRVANLLLGESENNRRAKFHRRTRAGERQLGVKTNEWETIARAIGNALNAT
jgi:hypothetical protein